MTRTFTLDDLIRYIYGETSTKENELIEVLLATDADFQEKHRQMLDVVKELKLAERRPSEDVIQKILNFSKEYNLHSV